jgi:putative ABC transport system ATP-binding protein
MAVIAKVENASKVYKSGETEIVALQPTTLEIRSGELLLIVGPSGSGKTTLLSLLGCVIYPTSGKVLIDGINTSDLNDDELAFLRLNKLGFVFQNFNLIQPLTALQNVMMPLELQGKSTREAKEKAENALAFVGLSHRKKSLPKQLSGGEQQRVAIARALVSEPMLMLCDEPTAALDSKSVGTVMKELRDLSDKGRSLAVVTHDARLRDYAHRVVEVENGIVREAGRVGETLSSAAQ